MRSLLKVSGRKPKNNFDADMNITTQLIPVRPMQVINHVEIPAILQKGVKASKQYKQIPGS